MAKHLSRKDVQAIVDLINHWTDQKMTWEMIAEASAPLVGKKPTRQSLHAHGEIASAYRAKKEFSRRIQPRTPMPASLTIAADRIASLEARLCQLEAENSRFMELFVLWQYNAYKHGMTERQLNAPLPVIDRLHTRG